MGAVKKTAIQRDVQLKQPVREIPPADYSDEVTQEQIEAGRKQIGDQFKDWPIVDGPAW